MKNIYFLLFLVVMTNYSLAQKSFFREATITKVNGEKLRGFVEYISESDLSTHIAFKKTLDNQEKISIEPSNVEELNLVENKISFGRVEYKYSFNDQEYKEYRLAKKMLSGYTSLFKLQLRRGEYNLILEKDNTYVYILRISDKDYVLKQTEMLNGTTYKLDRNYRGVLAYLFRDAPSLRNQIENLDFNDKDIQNIVLKYNEKFQKNESIVYESKVKSIKYHNVELCLGTLMNNPDIDGIGVNFGYFFEISNPELSEKISTKIGVGYTMYQFSNGVEKERKGYVRVPLLASFKFSKSNVIPYVDLGVVPTFSSNTNDIFINVGFGCVFNDKFQVKAFVDSESLNFNHTIVAFVSFGFRFK